MIRALFAALAFVCLPALAEPIYEARGDGLVVTIYREPCALEAVTNLPKRATWQEGDKVYEGCAGAMPQLGIAIFYFSDRTVAIFSISAFVKLRAVGT